MVPFRVKEAGGPAWLPVHFISGGILLLTLIVLIGMWSSVLLQIRHGRAETEAAARQRVEEIARTVEARLIDRLGQIDHMMQHVRSDLQEPPGLQRGHLSAASVNLEVPGLLQLAVIDAAGQRVDSTVPFTPGEDLSHCEFFRVHRDRPAGSGADPLFIGKPVVGQVSDRQLSMHVSRRIDSPDGQFLGVLVASIDPVAFTGFADDLPIEQGGNVAVVGTDRVLRMWHSSSVTALQRSWIGRELPADRIQFNPQRPMQGVDWVHSVIDARPLLMAYRRMAAYPLITVVHLSRDDIFRRSDRHAAEMLTSLSAVSIVVLLFAGGLVFFAWRQHRTSQALSAANEGLRHQERALEQRVAERTHALERSNRQLYEMAYHDPLTHLPNRARFNEHAADALHNARCHSLKMALLLLDIDHFKVINETLGYAAGDEILTAVAARLRQINHPSMTISRMGDDEFAIVLEGLAHHDEAALAAERVLTVLSAALQLGGQSLDIRGSIGIAVFPNDGEDVATLVRNADMAMDAAKAAGRNSVQFFDPAMSMSAARRLELEHALRRALRNGEFSLAYQPKVQAATGQLCGVEALIRWQHPECGWISPGEFIPIAEATGLIEAIGSWVLEDACRTLAEWAKSGAKPLPIAVNVAAAQINRGNLASLVEDLIKRYDINPSYLEIEITESAVIKNTCNVITTLSRLHALGVSVALDDFGTGYSSLSYLRELDLNTIKIDRSFLVEAQPGSRGAAIFELIIKLAKALHLTVVAEGVETDEQAAFVRNVGCDLIQGFLVARPMAKDDLLEWILKRRDGMSISVSGTHAI